MDLYVLEPSLVYTVASRPDRATEWGAFFKEKKAKTKRNPKISFHHSQKGYHQGYKRRQTHVWILLLVGVKTSEAIIEFETCREILKLIKIKLPWDSVPALLNMYPNDYPRYYRDW